MRLLRHPARLLAGLCCAIAIAGATPAASATLVAFDNFGPEDSYGNSGWWFGTSGPTPIQFATSFTPTLSGEIAGLTAAIVSNWSGLSFTLSIRGDANGPTGALLWQDTLSDTLLSPFGSVMDIVIPGPAVTAGTTYWIVAETSAPTFYTWLANTTGDTGPISLNPNGAGWSTTATASRAALRVVLVPEPETASLLGLGLAALSVHSRRRRNRFQFVSGTSPVAMGAH